MSTFGDTTTQDTTAQDTTPQDQTTAPGRSSLSRAYNGRMIAGVCAGLGDYFGIDVTIVRVAFAVFTFVGGIGVPAYLACLLLIPEEGSEQSIASALFDSVQHGL